MTKQFLSEMYAPLPPTLAKMAAVISVAKAASFCRDNGLAGEAKFCAEGIHDYWTAK